MKTKTKQISCKTIAAAPELYEALKKAESGLIELGAALGRAGDRTEYKDAESGLIAVQRALTKATTEGKEETR